MRSRRSITKTARASCRHSLPPHTIVLPELLTTRSRERLVQHTRGILPTSLHLGQVLTYGIDACIRWQRCTKVLPLSCHLLTDRAFQGIHHTEQAHQSCRIGQVNGVHGQIHEVQVIQSEIRCCFSWVQVPADDREWLIACECFARAFFHDVLLPRLVCLAFSLAIPLVTITGPPNRDQNIGPTTIPEAFPPGALLYSPQCFHEIFKVPCVI